MSPEGRMERDPVVFKPLYICGLSQRFQGKS